MIQVRRLQPVDLDYIFQNAESLGFHQNTMINKLENIMLVIEDNNICGIGLYINYEDKCILNRIYIKEDQRRKRLGTILVKTILNTVEHQGALQAYMHGSCDEFAEYLGFQKLSDSNQIIDTKMLYQEIFNDNISDNIFKVSLIDYFKPCSHQ
ncbi:MAG: hypothetical protein A2Y23_13150 [Clostridiales bacterium GWB2_37_7]|nr:MAG: hypothetical protein A2Y23_13150 [Clostridiales bacterium GWB2_37_7]